MLPPLLGAAKARLGARSSRMRKWVESEPWGRSPESEMLIESHYSQKAFGISQESVSDAEMAT